MCNPFPSGFFCTKKNTLPKSIFQNCIFWSPVFFKIYDNSRKAHSACFFLSESYFDPPNGYPKVEISSSLPEGIAHTPLKVRSAGSQTKSGNTCETVGHFCLTDEHIAESESDREIRSIFGDYIIFCTQCVKD